MVSYFTIMHKYKRLLSLALDEIKNKQKLFNIVRRTRTKKLTYNDHDLP